MVRAGMSRIKKDSGFTLVEVLIALAILVIGLLGTLTLGITSINQNAYTRHLAQATTLAEEELENLLSLPYTHSSLTDTDGDGADGLDDADSTTADHSFSGNPVDDRFYIYWNVAEDRAGTTVAYGVKTIVVIVRWREGGNWHTFKVSSIKARK
jgi:prepilin-type N-terminal cleavage/methylation domain-containing protein